MFLFKKLNSSINGATFDSNNNNDNTGSGGEIENDEFVIVNDGMTQSGWVEVNDNIKLKENEQKRLLSMYQVKYEEKLQYDELDQQVTATQQVIENESIIVPSPNTDMMNEVYEVKQTTTTIIDVPIKPQQQQEEQQQVILTTTAIVQQQEEQVIPTVPQIKEEEPEWLKGKTNTNYITRENTDFSYTSTVNASKPYTVASNDNSYTSNNSNNNKPYFSTSNDYSYTSTSKDTKPYTSTSKSSSSYSYCF